MDKPGIELRWLRLPREAGQSKWAGWGAALLAMLLVLVSPSASSCPYRAWDEYRGIKLLRLPDDTAYIYSPIQVRIDADGAPNAYHPDDARLLCRTHASFKGLDCLPHAGYPDTDWWSSVLVPDPRDPGRPYVQPPSSEFAGFFVSQTALEDMSKAVTNPARYVDSRTIPYVVFPGGFLRMSGTGAIGDLGYAINLTNGKQSPFVVADIGPSNAQLGEISIALAEAMGGSHPNAVTGAGSPRGRIVYIVFPKSGQKYRWPLTLGEMRRRVQKLLAAAGGAGAVRACRARLR